MFESKSGILLIGGLGFFLFAFLSNAVVPMMMYRDLPEKTVEELVAENSNLMYQFEDLSRRYAATFEKYYGKPTQEACAEALRIGREVYVEEGCWHCHSQFVRPVSREEDRWGPVSRTEEYQNELQRPVMFGTRRVGPDLSREGGRRSNDWHAVHFYRPKLVSTDSPMPEYPWLFDDAPDEPDDAEGESDDAAREPDDAEGEPEDEPDEPNGSPDMPNKRGLALITYVQWLGSWLEEYPYYEDYQPIELEETP